jgi:hypothetical protein
MQVTWSLAIEEQFYFLIAIILPLLTFYGKTSLDSTWLFPDHDHEFGLKSDSLSFVPAV